MLTFKNACNLVRKRLKLMDAAAHRIRELRSSLIDQDRHVSGIQSGTDDFYHVLVGSDIRQYDPGWLFIF